MEVIARATPPSSMFSIETRGVQLFAMPRER
jgi:hypothetical protein